MRKDEAEKIKRMCDTERIKCRVEETFVPGKYNVNLTEGMISYTSYNAAALLIMSRRLEDEYKELYYEAKEKQAKMAIKKDGV